MKPTLKSFLVAAGALAVLAVPLALFTAPPEKAQGVLGAALGLVSTPTGLAGVFGALTAVLGLVGIDSVVRKRRVALAAYHAFHIVEDLGAERPGPDVFDKGAAFLGALNDYFLANGWRPPKPGEQQLALLKAKEIHGTYKAEEKLRQAAVAAVPSAFGAVHPPVNELVAPRPPTPLG